MRLVAVSIVSRYHILSNEIGSTLELVMYLICPWAPELLEIAIRFTFLEAFNCFLTMLARSETLDHLLEYLHTFLTLY
jgi:hypothetical protein